MVELDFSEIAVYEQDYDDKEARMRTISMNNLRGEFDVMKLASLLKELREEYKVSEDVLAEETGMTVAKIQALESMIKSTEEIYALVGKEKEEKEKLHDMIDIYLSDMQFELMGRLQDYANVEDVKAAIVMALAYMIKNMNAEDAHLYYSK